MQRRFEEKWAYHPSCEEVVRIAWEAENVTGSPMFRLFEKVKRCLQLVEWSRTIFGSVQTKLQEKQSALEELSLQNDPQNLPAIRDLRRDINTLLHQDEMFWRQRLRAIWLLAGDKNTKFFHQRASQRR